MDPRLAQALVDGFAALALLAYALRVGPGRSPVRARLRFVFLLAGLFYAVRALWYATLQPHYETASLMIAGVLPLGALVLAEALLRRHAPKLLKLAVLVGAGVATVAPLLPGGDWRGLALMAYVVGAFAAIWLLVLTRDRRSLAAAENATLDAISGALLAVALLAATDFGDLAPVGLSGLGALALAYAAAGARPAGMAAVLGVALLLAAGLAAGAPDLPRLAICLSALGALAVLLRLQAGGREDRRQTLLRTLASASDAGLAAFVADAARHPALADLALLEGDALGEYDAEALRRAFARFPVVAAARLPDLDADAREQLLDLMTRHAATHAALVSAAPLRLALIATGATRAGDDEAELLVFQRLAARAARSGP
ncbi:hypothetical protein [Phenylobacterium sp.]|jgi:hypothetical protein|uniref:hypothetical protein n=1 Tax=Phenylobacterium sp. TaxID=1871053 RepID=UPI002F923E9E